MTRLLIATFLLIPAALMAQDTTNCAAQLGLQNDLDGDMLVGVSDLVQFLSWFGTNFDLDQDGILDCEDECVGTYDECGVCNGPGPQVLTIDTIIITFDSIYVEAINDWLVYELGPDTLFSLVCDESNGFSSCGDDMEMDGYSYSTVLIGDQCWFAENLRTTVHANGDLIPAGLTDEEWTSTTACATAVYGEASSNCNTDYTPDIDACDEAQSLMEYGRLYNWYAVNDARGLCPTGWHVPTDGEWSQLGDYVISQGYVGGTEGTALKSTSGWSYDTYDDMSGNGTDDYGFSALPGGVRCPDSGNFLFAGGDGGWWSSSSSGDYAWSRSLFFNVSFLLRSDSYPRGGFSVRCVGGANVLGCTDPAYIEYNASATADDGSCLTLLFFGCTDSAYVEYNVAANMEDGSCTNLVDPNCIPPNMDGYDYDVVQIGDQCWFTENLRTTVYTNGDIIPAGLNEGDWNSTIVGATAVYGEGTISCSNYSPDVDACDEAQSLAAYGRLYNWYAVDDARGLCPAGWHVPTDGEWTGLEDYITSQGYDDMEGAALKSTTGWNDDGIGTDDFGFSALPGGVRDSGSGYFNYVGGYGYWWSSSSVGGDAWQRRLYATDTGVFRSYSNPQFGFSVRCLRDSE